MKILVLGAHPDDCEIRCGGTAALLVARGHQVRFLSATNGNKGHHAQSGQALEDRRREEARAAATVLGVESRVLDIPDGEIQPDLETRWKFIREIRDFAPDILITHRPWDYHPDHRIVGQVVQDCSYLIRVPLVCPDAPVPDQAPVILLMWDGFTQPTPFRPDIAFPVDAVYEQKLRALACHESQVFEWLPWIDGREPAPQKTQARLQWLEEWLGPRDEEIADGARQVLQAEYGESARGVRRAEAFEMSEYGRRVSPDALWVQMSSESK